MCAQVSWLVRGGKVVPILACCCSTHEEQSLTESAIPRLSRCFIPMLEWKGEEKGLL